MKTCFLVSATHYVQRLSNIFFLQPTFVVKDTILSVNSDEKVMSQIQWFYPREEEQRTRYQNEIHKTYLESILQKLVK